jgi:hypothetical protein
LDNEINESQGDFKYLIAPTFLKIGDFMLNPEKDTNRLEGTGKGLINPNLIAVHLAEYYSIIASKDRSTSLKKE